MASHKSGHASSARLVPRPAVPQGNSPTRLPVRNALNIASLQRGIPTTSKLTKKNPNTSQDNEQAHAAIRSIQKAAVSGLVAVEEASRETPSPTKGSRSRTTPPDTQQPKTSRIARFEPTRTPSLVSGSSASTADSPKSNLGRRRPVVGAKNFRASPSDSMSSQDEQIGPDPLAANGYKDPFPDAVLGIGMPPSVPPYHRPEMDEDVIIHLDKYVNPPALITGSLPPPTPLYALSTTPSTGYSPGPFSVTSTPTSMSSHSPGIVLSASRTGQRLPQASPIKATRPGVARKFTDETPSTADPDRVASVRESSSSSASTIRASDNNNRLSQKAKLSPMPAPPPSPPQGRPSAGSISSPSKTNAGTRPTYPEFAHLNNVSVRKGSFPSAAPTRPSRDGTPEFNFQQQASPVIQSNMSSLPSSLHKRQSSSESKRTNASALSLDMVPRFIPARSLSRNPSPSPSQSSALSPMSSHPPTRGITPDIPSDGERSVKVKATPPMSSKPFSRLAFFSKKSKPEQGPTVLTKERPAKRGPAAGTGHEGYGKFAVRGRSGSTTSGSGSTSVGRSPSVDSTPGSAKPSSRKSSIGSQAGSDIDDFFADRLAPITIRGSAPSTPALGRTQNGGSTQESALVDSVPGLGLANTTVKGSTASQNGALKRPVLLPSPISDQVLPNEPVKRPSTGFSDKKSDSSKSGRFGKSGSSSKRTSLMSFMGDKSNPATSSTTNIMAPSARKGAESTGLSRTITASSDEGNWPHPLKKAEAVPKVTASSLKPPRKWNFFQRAKSPARRAKEPEAVPVTVPRQLPTRSVAHYAIMEPPKTIDLEELERIMSEAEKDSDDPGLIQRGKSGQKKADKGKRPIHGNSILLPEPPTFNPDFAGPARPASPKVALRTQVASPRNAPTYLRGTPAAEAVMQPIGATSPIVLASPPQSAVILGPAQAPVAALPRQVEPMRNQLRPSRLPQVGRIPKVISRRERQAEHERKPSNASFSRPFAPAQPSPALRSSIGNALDLLSAASPELRKQHTSTFKSVASPDLAANPPLEADEDRLLSPAPEDQLSSQADSEFLKFPPRKDSEMSTGSSSSGMLQFVSHLLIAPALGAHSGEDDIWKEYDEFLDALSPRTPKTPKSAVSTGSSAGAPFHYAFSLSQPDPRFPGRPPPPDETVRLTEGQQSQIASPSVPHAPSVGETAQKMRINSTTDSRLLSADPPLVFPTSPLSISEFVNGYGERNLSVIDPTSGRLSLPSAGRFSMAPVRHSLPGSGEPISSPPANARLPSLPGNDSSPQSPANKRRDSRLIELAEKKHMGLENMADLRFGALMTSKWLSFGRVLFSPVHHELKDPAEHRVLILDGLGKDWSYYVALTYPSASIYNLGSDPVDGPGAPLSGSPYQAPPNHRHIHHPSLGSPFPFPKGFFAAVVFRFPIANSEAAYRAALFECKRVLRPGGYLELSVLDIDMVNMGNRARRAVRQLKMEMQALDPGVSLKPICDLMQKLVGRRGFENLNRCIVGVPAAGRIPGSRDESIEGSSTTGDQSASSDGKVVRLPNLDQEMPLFSDLLHDPSKEGDEGITKMVARVGRWWYSRCYESIVLPNGDPAKSIWADEALIRECEKRGTSLRLMVCFAQKPECAVRRTISV